MQSAKNLIGLDGIVESLELGQQPHALSSFENSLGHYTVVAIGFKSTIQIYKLFSSGFTGKDSIGVNSHLSIQLASRGQESFSMITDISWSPNAMYDSCLAVSSTSGSVSILSVPGIRHDSKPISYSTVANHKIEWESSPQDFSGAVNAVSWDGSNKTKRVLCAAQDGNVKTVEVSIDNGKLGTRIEKYISGQTAVACKVARFCPSHPQLFAAAYDNGSLCIWNCITDLTIYESNKPLVRISAHPECIISIDWHPTIDYQIATAGRDKLIKVWDLNILPSLISASSATSALQKVILWRGSYRRPGTFLPSDMDKYKYHIASCNGAATSTSGIAGRSSIFLWDVTLPHFPIIALRGHMIPGNAVASGSSTPPPGSMAESTGNAENSSVFTSFEWLDTPDFDQDYSELQSKAPKSKSARIMQRLYQHVIAATKEGKLLIYDARQGYFLRSHMANAAVHLSATGTLAYHCANIFKNCNYGLVARGNGYGHGFYKENPKKFGMILFPQDVDASSIPTSIPSEMREASDISLGDWPESLALKINMKIISEMDNKSDMSYFNVKSEMKEVNMKGMMHKERRIFGMNGVRKYAPRGVVTMTREDESGIGNQLMGHAAVQPDIAADALLTNTEQNIELEPNESIFDPMIITLFAKYLRTGLDHSTINMRNISNECQMIDVVIDICSWNYNVAQSVNCGIRAALWSNLIVLLPTLVQYAFQLSNPVATHPLVGTRVSLSLPNVPVTNKLSGDSATTNSKKDLDVSLAPQIIDVIQALLLQLMDQGDVQHTVICHEILIYCKVAPLIMNNQNKGELTMNRMKEAYSVYIALLQRLNLYAIANVLVKHSHDVDLTTYSRTDTLMHVSCGKCEKEIAEPTTTSDTPPPVWCMRCNLCVTICSVCQQPIRGLLHWCPVCSHGAHLECHKRWFEAGNVSCPTGCGHNCC